jgi:hypothetical protein
MRFYWPFKVVGCALPNEKLAAATPSTGKRVFIDALPLPRFGCRYEA